MPNVAGSSQARALISTIRSGGKSPGPSRARALLETGEPFLEEALTPEGDDFPSRLKAASDLIILDSIGSEQDHPGSLDLIIR
jgi:hypothetical protein